MQEPLEHFNLRQPVEQGFRILRVHRGSESARFGRVTQHSRFYRHEHMRVSKPVRRGNKSSQLFDRLQACADRSATGPPTSEEGSCRSSSSVIPVQPAIVWVTSWNGTSGIQSRGECPYRRIDSC